MDRRLDKANKKIFERLIEKARGVKSDGKTRWIVSGSTDEDTIETTKNYIKRTKIIDSFLISRHIVCSILEFENKRYFSISGVKIQSNILDSSLIETDEVGLMLVILSDSQIALEYTHDDFYIEQNILANYNEDSSEYSGHLYSEIKQCFVPIKVFDISGLDFKPNQTIHKLAGTVLCCQDNDFLEPFSPETIEKFKDIFVGNNKYIPFDNLVYGLHSISWKHKFIEVYRCIESLYPAFAVKKLYDDLNFDKSHTNITDFYQKINNQLGWSRKERESLEKMVSVSMSKNNSIQFYFSNGIPPKYIKIKVYNFLYDTRNSIVHFCAIEIRDSYIDINEINNNHWNNIICGMLEIIRETYSEYEAYMN